MKYVFAIVILAIFSAVPASAQASKDQKTPAPKKPAAAVQAEKPAETKPKMKTPKTAKDLDAFFKEGQEQAKDGPRCDRPPAPIA